jgi:hypothetical protein
VSRAAKSLELASMGGIITARAQSRQIAELR